MVKNKQKQAENGLSSQLGRVGQSQATQLNLGQLKLWVGMALDIDTSTNMTTDQLVR